MRNPHLPVSSLLLDNAEKKVRWKDVFTLLFQKKFKPEEVKSFLLLTAKKGVAAGEILGCLDALRRFEQPVAVDVPYLMDICGTGGDGKQTFNVSTVASFVIAGAGGYVAKHGNRGISSKVGSSDLMEALGIRIDLSFGQLLNVLKRCHLAYFHAPYFHPSFASVQSVRREIGVRTLFNLLGPLVNPVRLHYQIVGVSRPEWLMPVACALKWLGRKRAAVFLSRDGMDELSTSEPSDILCVTEGRIRKIEIQPKEFGFSKAKPTDYQGGDLSTNRKLALRILEGRLTGPPEDIVLLNSGFALWIAGLATTVGEGIVRSRQAIKSGQAMWVLKNLRRETKKRK